MLTVIIPYYNNAAAVSAQLREFGTYPEETLACLRLILVDDGSAITETVDFAALTAPCLHLTVLRIGEDIPWHQGPARNLGVLMSTTDWLLLTDVDHFLSADQAKSLLEFIAAGPDKRVIYRVQRYHIATGTPERPPDNCYVVNRSRFIRLRGADPDFAGHYGYQDLDFTRRWLEDGGTFQDLPNVTLGVEREMATRVLNRDVSVNAELREKKRLRLTPQNRRMIEAPWEVLFQSSALVLRGATGLFPSNPNIDVSLSSIVLNPKVNPYRTPDVPLDLRPADLEACFDSSTYCFDFFRETGSPASVLLCPPLPDGLDWERDVTFRPVKSRAPIPFSVENAPARGLVYVRLRAPRGISACEIRVGNQHFVRTLQPNHAAIFAGRRVLVTKSRDNELPWISDWVRYHAVHFGVDAVLLYDDGSTSYTVEDVHAVISAVPGVDTAVVVPWGFPTGCYNVNPAVFWSQAAMLEHARRRFLGEASMVFQLDIDELLVQTGDIPLDVLVDNHPSAAWFPIRRRHVRNVRFRGTGKPRHRDFWFMESGKGRMEKYVVLPSRMNQAGQWDVHRVHGGKGRAIAPDLFEIAHFLPLTTGWQGREKRLSADDPESLAGSPNERLKECLDTAFPETSTVPAPWTPLMERQPFMARRTALELQESGRIAGALQYAAHAWQLEPEDPRHLALVRQLIKQLADAP